MKVFELCDELTNAECGNVYLNNNNNFDISCLIDDNKFIIDINPSEKEVKTKDILSFIDSELKKKECDRKKFFDLDVYIRDFGDLFEIKRILNFSNRFDINYYYKKDRGVLLLKVEKDEASVKKAFKKILNVLVDLDRKDIEKLIDKTSTNSVESFKEFKTNIHDLLREKGIEEYIKSWGKPKDINEISDWDLYLPYMYMDVIEEKDFYYVSFGLFPEESFHG